MAVYGPISTGACAGGAGASTATVDSGQIVRGFVVGIYLQYNDSPPAATTDVTVKTKGATGVLPSYNLLVMTNGATDGFYATQFETRKSTDGTASGQYAFPYIEDKITITIAQANDNDSVTAWIYTVD